MKWKKPISIMLCFFLLCMDIYVGNGLKVQAQGSTDAAGRETLNFNTDWLYSSTNYENGAAVRLDDSGFDKVSVPHANTILEKHKGDDFPGQIASYRFISWYRRHFTLPQNYAGRNITVDFEGVATIADVYLNGELLESHKGAYTGFSVDITDKVYTDGRENILAVRVNSERQPQIPPEGGSVDYCLFGGIVRDVTMTITEPVHVKQVFVTTPDLTQESGKVHNSVDILNNSKQGKSYTVETTVLDKEGRTVASDSKAADIPAGKLTNVVMTTNVISNPHLWDIDDPYLYTAVTKIKDGNAVIDTYNTRFGMRFMEFKTGPEDGSFYLNGQKIEIIGINRHEQWPWIGRAVPDKLQVQDADLIKANGINAVRCSHYPQDPSFLDRCDEIGLLVFEEPPGWQHVGNDEWKNEFKYNLEELILRDRNHPSIISWGARPNESNSKNNLAFNKECEAISKRLDPTRPTHGVRWEYSLQDTATPVPGTGASDPDTQEQIDVNDILTVNYRYPENPPHIPYMVTEHSNDWWGDGYSWAKDKESIAFIDSFAKPLDYFYSNDKVAGGFGWSMFDYNNEVNYTKTGHVFYSGLYDIFRHEKAVAYLYKSQAEPGDEPVIYIANSWTKEGTNTNTVYVMSNCDEVELFVNNVSKGKIKPNKYTNLPHPIYEFKNIPYEAGELAAVGYIKGQQAGEYVRKTAGEPARLVAEADYSTLTADGTDMTSVSVTAVDADGNHVPFAANKINVTQTGGAETTLISEKNVELENGKIAFLVQSVRDSVGTAQFTVTSDGLESATVDITINPFTADNLVPAVSGSGSLAPASPDIRVINDHTTGSGQLQFNYSGKWSSSTDSACYEGDNYWSNEKDAYVTFAFTGTSLKYYSTKNYNIGIAAFSIDNGEEEMVDLYQAAKADQQLVYEVNGLPSGSHTLKVRVTGDKNAAASDCCIVADKIEVSSHEEDNCSHTRTELWNKIPSSCTKTGYTGDTYCLDCGIKISDGKVTAVSAHRWNKGVVTTQPTTAKAGVKTFTCTVCSTTRTEAVAKLKAPKKGAVLKDTSTKAEYKVLTVKTSKGKVSGTVAYKKPSASAKTVTIPAKITVNGGTYTVTAIADKAFQNNKKLTKVTIGSNVTTIGASAFRGCIALTKITIPAKVKKIGKQSFYGCKKLKNITIKTTKLKKSTVGSNAFKGIYAKATIKVPKSKLKSYQSILKARGVGKKAKIKK